jgi:bifunctional non-homologous end joining protein LigD
MAKTSFETTHPEKVMFPAVRYTKGQVVDYYRSVAPLILPHLKNRPLTLKLYPNGVAGKHVYLKDAPSHTPAWVKTFAIERKDKSKGNAQIDFILVNDLRTLLWAANLSSLEMHTFLARVPRIDRPTAVVFDLDPGPPAGVLDCAEVAIYLHDLLDEFGLESFVKASASKGLQVYVPLNTPITYDATEPFAQRIAELLEGQHPKLVVSQMAKSLRAGKVFIDWSQNVYYKTTVCVYSLRAKSERPYVSLPFTWKEIRAAAKAADRDRFYFSPEDALKRFAKVGDLFEPVLTLKQKLPAELPHGSHRESTPRESSGAVASKPQPGRISPRFKRMLNKRPSAKPEFLPPMQPELVSRLPEGHEWQYEVKWDGYRAIAVKIGAEVELYSRNRKSLSGRYPSIVEQLRAIACDQSVIDGELVAFDDQGRPSFQSLQNFSSKAGQSLSFIAFDTLNVDGHSTLGLPLSERQELLADVLNGSAIQLSEPLNADLPTVLQVLRKQQLEGALAKDRQSIYEPGSRGRSWFKLRLGLAQEFVVGGYTTGSPFNSLLVGYYQGRKLLYAGKVNAGFSQPSRRKLFEQITPLRITRCPFANLPQEKSGRWGEGLTAQDIKKCVWLKPWLVVQVSFVEWTENDHLRHAKFLGTRDDKKPTAVRREE